MPKMNPVRVGTPVPPEANKQGTLNETVSETERNPKPPAVISDGPKRGERGECLPAAYKTRSGSVRVDH